MMSQKFSSGKYAQAICDRCGIQVKYQQLKEEWTGLMVCMDCWDPKTALEFPMNFPSDPESLRDPRPDNDTEAGNGRIFTSSNVIGSTIKGFGIECELGDVTVSMA